MDFWKTFLENDFWKEFEFGILGLKAKKRKIRRVKDLKNQRIPKNENFERKLKMPNGQNALFSVSGKISFASKSLAGSFGNPESAPFAIFANRVLNFPINP